MDAICLSLFLMSVIGKDLNSPVEASWLKIPLHGMVWEVYDLISIFVIKLKISVFNCCFIWLHVSRSCLINNTEAQYSMYFLRSAWHQCDLVPQTYTRDSRTRALLISHNHFVVHMVCMLLVCRGVWAWRQTHIKCICFASVFVCFVGKTLSPPVWVPCLAL